MAKTKKMFGGGMSSRMAAPRAPMMSARMGGMGSRPQAGGAMSQRAMQAGAAKAAPAADANVGKAQADYMAQKAAAAPAAPAAPAAAAGAPMRKGGVTKMAKGGVAESKKMVGKEVAFMKKKGAPKSMIKHEESEMKAMKTKKYAKGGMVAPSKMGSVRTAAPSRDGIASKGKTKGTMVKMAGAKGMKYGGKC